MADVLVVDWIEEFEALTESEIHTYAAEQEHNHEVSIALHTIFEEDHNNKQMIIDRICQQLFAFYRSGESGLKKFAMQYIPHLVLLHLAHRKTYPSIETLIVSLYNLEVVDSKGQPRIKSFRVPSLAQSSMYHDSSNLDPAFLAENSLRRWEECNTKLVNWGPLPQVEALNAQNRQRVVTALVFLFNQQIASFNLQGIEYICRAISRIVSQGFQVTGGIRTSVDSDSFNISMMPRILVSSQLLLELLHIVYHALERDVSGAAQTLHDVTQRATYETYTDVLLAAHAITNLLHRSPAAYMPARSSNKQIITKSMITNASFRTKKLPDDIPIQHQEDAGGAGDASLDSIVEEGGSDAPDKKGFRGRSGSALKHLPKLSGLGKKPKLKSSPTPPRHSLEETPVTGGNSSIGMMEMKMNAGTGDQVSLVASNSNGSMQNELSLNTVHVSTV
ncbi:PREDICTED: hyccin [Nicrophorus vespilloides]|uniref:Hyccin n=1 Tax=Nicrophorus vespilloides TaxID=110193 RepID=A0ABM1MD08_NICVS|nr:PREDICTED: hyccin [Nicrophorus vespilloides]